MRRVVVHDEVDLDSVFDRDHAVQIVEKSDELPVMVRPVAAAYNLAGQDVEGGEK